MLPMLHKPDLLTKNYIINSWLIISSMNHKK